MADCACESVPSRFLNVERVLVKYIADCLRRNEPFYISPDLNDAALSGSVNPDQLEAEWGKTETGLGFLAFLAPVFSAVAGAASTVGSAAASILPQVASIAGSAASIQAISQTNKVTAPQSVAVPTAIAPQVVNAVQQDMLGGLGISNTTLLIGAGVLGLVLLMR